MAKPDKQAQAGQSKLTELEAALKAENAAWLPKQRRGSRQAEAEALGCRAAGLLAALESGLLMRGEEVGAGGDEALLAVVGLLGGLLTGMARQAGWSPAQQEILREWAIETIRTLPFVTGEEA